MRYQLDKVYKAKKQQPSILIVVLDRNECDLGFLQNDLKHIEGPRRSGGKMMEGDDIKQYYGNCIKLIKNYLDRVEKVVIAGPGFSKEEIQKIIKEKEPEISKKLIMENAAHTGINGIREVINRGTMERVLKNSRIGEESQLVKKFFEEISKEGEVVYGIDEVKRALEMGAVEKLIISEHIVKENEKLLEKTEKQRGEIEIISNDHEAGKRFKKFQVAGFLRFRI